MHPFCLLCLCHTVLSVPCRIEDTCWESADLLAFLRVMSFLCFVTFPYGALDQVWYVIVLNPDLCLLPYFCNRCALQKIFLVASQTPRLVLDQ